MSSILDGSLRISSTDTPTREGERIDSIGNMSSIPTPYVGMRVFVEDEKREYVILSLKDKMVSGVLVPNGAVDKYDAAARVSDLDGFDKNVERVEQELRTAIVTEQNRASSAEQAIRSNVSALEEEIEVAERRVETEESRAKAAEDALGRRIDKTYSKPSGGIPKSDLASAVQNSLSKADTAIQEEQYKGTVTKIKLNGVEEYSPNTNGEVDIYGLIGTVQMNGKNYEGGSTDIVDLGTVVQSIKANGVNIDVSNGEVDIPAANKDEYGVVKLSSAVNNSETVAITPKALKTVKDEVSSEVEELKRRLVVRVVTEDEYAAIENKNDGVLYAILEKQV